MQPKREDLEAPDASGAAFAEFSYRPVWDTETQTVYTYLCERAAPQADAVDLPLEQVHLERDMLAVRASVDRLKKLHAAGVRATITTPIHYTTIARPQCWTKLFELHRRLPKQISRNLGFAVLDIERNIAGIRAAQELAKIHCKGRKIMCLVDETYPVSQRLNDCGIHVLGIASRPDQVNPNADALLQRLIENAREIGAEVCLLNTPTTATALRAIGLGVRYLEGPAIKTVVTDQRQSFVFWLARRLAETCIKHRESEAGIAVSREIFRIREDGMDTDGIVVDIAARTEVRGNEVIH